MSVSPTGVAESQETIVPLLENVLPEVFDYLSKRVNDRAVAEDLLSETMLAALVSLRRSPSRSVGTGWFIGIARHKLVDHWRRQERERSRIEAAANQPVDLSWDGTFEPGAAAATLELLNPSQRAALTFRYVDGLPVAEVAELLGRSIAATENLLMRSKSAFRSHYARRGGGSDE